VEYQSTRYGYALKLDAGEEIVATLASFAAQRGVRAGMISGIGSVRDPELGFFLTDHRTYERRTFHGEWEIGSLTGNLSDLEGQPFAHCHVVLGGADFTAWTGHLFRGVVTLTCEVHVVVDPGIIRRLRREDLGFHPLRLEP
jgi:hypothetical protein